MNLKNVPKKLDSKTSALSIKVPENLDLALEGLIRKVLKDQPQTGEIYKFAANYFDVLLKIRDKAGQYCHTFSHLLKHVLKLLFRKKRGYIRSDGTSDCSKA